MKSGGFGRRVGDPRPPDLTVVEGNQEAADPVATAATAVTLAGLKERIRSVLMTRIDAAIAGRMPRLALRAEIAELVREIATEQRVQLNEAEESNLAAELTDDMTGLGPLEPFLQDDEITDILVNGPYDIYIEKRGKLIKTTARFRDPQHVVNVAQRIASGVGRRIDEASPMVDARLADGSRVNIILAPLVVNGGTISIRKFPRQSITLETMIRQENLSEGMARVLEIAAKSRVNVLVSGGTGSGKTTLLNAISRNIDRDERIVTIEEAIELRLQQPHVVQMETRNANIEGVGLIAQRELVRNALRMRPDRIIVGEVRGPEAFDMLQAMNTGHEGSMSTIHANSPRDALYRLENMLMMATANMPLRALRMQIASALNLIVQVERMRDGQRRVQSIFEVAGIETDIIALRELFQFQHRGERRDGSIDGVFAPMRVRADLVARAARVGLDRELLEALEVVGG